MHRPDFDHEYDLNSLVLVQPKAWGFSMYITPRYREHYEQLPFEELSADLVSSLLSRTRLFVDVGAHYGFYALLAGKRDSSLEVIACEPTPETCKVLARNVALNELKNVSVQQIALSDTDGTASFNISLSSDSSGFHSNPVALPLRQLDVVTKRLDSLLAERAPCPTLIKMDTEGHELAVLRGLSSTIERFPDLRLLIAFNPMMQKAAGYPEEALLSHLRGLGFTVCLLEEKARHATYVASQQQLPELVKFTGYANLYCFRLAPRINGSKPRRNWQHLIESPRDWKLQARVLTIQGWCFGDQERLLRAVRVRRGKHVWNARYGLFRPDVGRAYPHHPLASFSGFEVEIKVPTLPGRLKLEALDQFGQWHPFHFRFVSRWRRMLKINSPPASAKPRHRDVAEALPEIFEHLRFTSCVLAISHSDYRIGVGGTQKLLQQEEELLAARRISYLEIHPSPDQPVVSENHQSFYMGLYVDSKHIGTFVVAQLRQILQELARAGVKLHTVHLHHLLGFDLAALTEILSGLQTQKTFFIHDFYSICKQHNLLKNDKEFCGGPPVGSPACRECSYGEQHRAHFEAFEGFLDLWKPDFIVPSKVACDVWSNSFPKWAHKVRVIPHLLQKEGGCAPLTRPAGGRIRIAYVGYQHPIKGWEEWKQFASAVRREHYELYVLGSCIEPVPDVQYVPVSFIDHGSEAMLRALRHHAIDLAFLWSLVPETYSFTLFESMAAGCFVLTNPRSGNIAAQVSQLGRGLVAKDLRELLDFLQDTKRVESCLEQFREKNPPFDLAPNPALADEMAAALPARPPFCTPTPAEIADRVSKLKAGGLASSRQP